MYGALSYFISMIILIIFTIAGYVSLYGQKYKNDPRSFAEIFYASYEGMVFIVYAIGTFSCGIIGIIFTFIYTSELISLYSLNSKRLAFLKGIASFCCGLTISYYLFWVPFLMLLYGGLELEDYMIVPSLNDTSGHLASIKHILIPPYRYMTFIFVLAFFWSIFSRYCKKWMNSKILHGLISISIVLSVMHIITVQPS